jgi:hypothetical protein
MLFGFFYTLSVVWCAMWQVRPVMGHALPHSLDVCWVDSLRLPPAPRAWWHVRPSLGHALPHAVSPGLCSYLHVLLVLCLHDSPLPPHASSLLACVPCPPPLSCTFIIPSSL